MRNMIFTAIAAVVILTSGCGARTIHMSPSISSRARLTPNVETVAVNNNTVFDLVIQEGGVTVRERTRDRSIKYYKLPTGESMPLGYYEFMGSSQISLVAKAYCPLEVVSEGDVAVKKEKTIQLERAQITCRPGDYMGISRPYSIYVSSGQNYRSSDWTISNQDIVGPTGRYY